MLLPRTFLHLSLIRRELQQWYAPLACRRQEKRPSISRLPVHGTGSTNETCIHQKNHSSILALCGHRCLITPSDCFLHLSTSKDRFIHPRTMGRPGTLDGRPGGHLL